MALEVIPFLMSNGHREINHWRRMDLCVPQNSVVVKKRENISCIQVQEVSVSPSRRNKIWMHVLAFPSVEITSADDAMFSVPSHMEARLTSTRSRTFSVAAFLNRLVYPSCSLLEGKSVFSKKAFRWIILLFFVSAVDNCIF